MKFLTSDGFVVNKANKYGQLVCIDHMLFLFFSFILLSQNNIDCLFFGNNIKLKRNYSSMCMKNDGIDKHLFYLFERILSFCMHCTQRTGASRVGTARGGGGY